MPKRTGNYDAWMIGELTDPQLAASYINAAISEDPDMLKVALGNVAKAHRMKNVAEEVGMARESLYTSLSEDGNPTLTNLNGILRAVGLKLAVIPDSAKSSVQEPQSGAAVDNQPIQDSASDAIKALQIASTIIVENFNAENFNAVNASAGIKNISFDGQVGIGILLPNLNNLRSPKIPYTPKKEVPVMPLTPEKTYLRQIGSPATIGAQ